MSSSEIQDKELMEVSAASLGSEASKVDAGTPYEYDPNFHGIIEDRKCTDICMGVFFVIFFCLLLALFFVALTRSNYKFLYIPTDHRGMMCGYDNSKIKLYNKDKSEEDSDDDNSAFLLNDPSDVEAEQIANAADPDPPGRGKFLDLTSKPYLFWVRPGKKGYVRSFCVESCPKEGLFIDTFNTMFKFPQGFKTATTHCGSSVNSTLSKLENYSNPGHYYCPYSTSLFAHRCLPTISAMGIGDAADNIKNNITEALNSVSSLNLALQDLTLTWKYIAISVVIALGLSLIWLFLLRLIASFMVWITVILALGGLAFLTYMTYKQRSNTTSAANVEAKSFGFVNKSLNQKIWTSMFVILVVFDAIFLLLIIFLFDRIRLSVGIIKCVSHVFGKVPQLFFFPIFIYILEFIWWAYVIGVAVVLFGAGKPYDVYDYTNSVHKIQYKYDTLIQGFSIAHFIGFLWITWFISALGQTTIAGVIADYYFTEEPKKSNLRKHIVFSSFGRALKYHVGSLAFGSLIITIMTIIRMVIEYIDQKTKASQSTLAKCCIKCMKCCFLCLDRILKYITRNAYIMIAIHGYNFWNACKQAFNLLLRNVARCATLNFVGDFTLFMGKVFVCGVVTAVAMLFFSKVVEGVTYAIIPAIIVFLISFLASGAFTGVFEMGIDSMFLCFLEDEERNDGSPGHEKYAPQELKDFLK